MVVDNFVQDRYKTFLEALILNVFVDFHAFLIYEMLVVEVQEWNLVWRNRDGNWIWNVWNVFCLSWGRTGCRRTFVI